MIKPISSLLFSPRLCPTTRLFLQARVHESQQGDAGEPELPQIQLWVEFLILQNCKNLQLSLQ